MVAGRSNVSKHRSTTNVAWSPAPKKNSDVQKGIEAIKRKQEGKHSNKSTQDFMDKLKESGDW